MKLAASLLGGVGIARVGFPVTPEAENAGVELSQEFALAARGIYSDCFCQTSTRFLLGSLVSTGDSGKMRVFSTGSIRLEINSQLSTLKDISERTDSLRGYL
tara:strand:- start:1747 stop:2052 length:306 start_codon:yes stop_codon:yes gene_type:complete